MIFLAGLTATAASSPYDCTYETQEEWNDAVAMAQATVDDYEDQIDVLEAERAALLASAPFLYDSAGYYLGFAGHDAWANFISEEPCGTQEEFEMWQEQGQPFLDQYNAIPDDVDAIDASLLALNGQLGNAQTELVYWTDARANWENGLCGCCCGGGCPPAP